MRRTFSTIGGSLIAAQFLGAPAHAAMTVSSDAIQNVSCVNGACSATAASAVLNFKTLRSMLTHGDVTLVSGQQAQDVVFAHAMRWASSHTLSLDAWRGVRIDRPMQATAGALASIGGFVGNDLTILPGISSSYWDMTASGRSATQGAGNKFNGSGITGMTDAQLKSGVPSGFSNQFRNQNGAMNDSLPSLIQLLELPPT